MMGSKVRVVIRAARTEDRAAREMLLRQGFAAHYYDAFLHFFFQELTLQCVVLCGAVLFIFMGAPVWVCAMLVPAAAAFVALAVYLAHTIMAENQIQKMCSEMSGWVAEARGPLGALPEGLLPIVTSVHQTEWEQHEGPVHAHVVGTASVSDYWGPKNSVWVHGVAVGEQWRRRGIARALVGVARLWAANAGLESLESVASAVGGGGGRAFLHSCGWALRHSYHRPLLGAALTLPMVQQGLDLPHA